MRVYELIEEIVKREGGYVDHPDDPGGPTNHGITEVVARAWGYEGRMEDLPVQVARDIYLDRYWTQPKFYQVHALSQKIAGELVDTGVNVGTGTATRFLQRALNVLNRQAKDFPDIAEDGVIGRMTVYALKTYLESRPAIGEIVLYRLLNSFQAVYYTHLAERDQKFESFVNGWIEARVD